jgi:Glycoside hydrolase 123, catalytic domain
MKNPLLLSLLFICGALCGQVQNNNNFVKDISFLSTASEFKNWRTKDRGKIERVIVKDGTAQLKITFPKYISGPEQWPAAQLLKKDGLPSDMSDYDTIRVIYRKISEANAKFSIVIKDESNKSALIGTFIDQSDWLTLELKFGSHLKANIQKIHSLDLFTGRPPTTSVIMVKSITLISTLPKALSNMAKSYRKHQLDQDVKKIENTLAMLRDGSMTLAEGKANVQKWATELRVKQKKKLHREMKKIQKNATYTVASTDSMTRVLPAIGTLPVVINKVITLSLAKNEYEATQLVVIAPEEKGLKKVRVTFAGFDKQFSQNSNFLTVSPVGFVKTTAPVYAVEHVGWHPDPLLEFAQSSDVAQGEAQSFWIRAHASATTKSGSYTGLIKINAENTPEITLQLTVTIFNFTLPKKSHLRTILSLYPSKLLKSKEQMSQAYDFVLDKYRLNPFSMYSGGAYMPPEELSLDNYTRRLPMGLTAIPLLYLKLPRQALFKGVANSRKKWDELPAEEKKKYPKAERDKIMAFLAQRVPKFKAAGIYKISYCYGFDEAKKSSHLAIADLCSQIKKKYPDIKIYSTAHDMTYGTDSVLGDLIDAWIPHDSSYSAKLAEKSRAMGNEVWWYSTSMFIDQKPLWDIRSQMGERAFKKNIDGFLYWTITRWQNNKKPITSVPYTTWNPMSFRGHNGGGSFLCMGPNKQLLPTIRLENIRDGLEDYEYYYLLRSLLNKKSFKVPQHLRKKAKKILSQKAPKSATDLSISREAIADLIIALQSSSIFYNF